MSRQKLGLIGTENKMKRLHKDAALEEWKRRQIDYQQHMTILEKAKDEFPSRFKYKWTRGNYEFELERGRGVVYYAIYNDHEPAKKPGHTWSMSVRHKGRINVGRWWYPTWRYYDVHQSIMFFENYSTSLGTSRSRRFDISEHNPELTKILLEEVSSFLSEEWFHKV